MGTTMPAPWRVGGLSPAFTGFGYDGRNAVNEAPLAHPMAPSGLVHWVSLGTVQQSFANDGKLQVRLDVLGRVRVYRALFGETTFRPDAPVQLPPGRSTSSESTPRRKKDQAGEIEPRKGR